MLVADRIVRMKTVLARTGLSRSVSAFPITYAARLDAATKLHGISSSMRL